MAERKRVLDARELMGDYRGLLEEGAVLPLRISGGSMLPFLAPGRDTVFIKKPGGKLKRGDIVFYERENGQYVLHRLVRGENGSLWFAGDAQDAVEGPLPEACAFAVAVSAERKGKTQKPGTFWWDFFAGVWLSLLGKRQSVMRLYGKLKP